MATVTSEALKQELAELWSIPVTEIFEKVLDVKRVIGDVSDCIVLGYLKRCDLNIEKAINYHFSRSLSPTPTGPEPQSNEQKDNNHNFTFEDEPSSNANNGNVSMNVNNENEFKMNDVVFVCSNDGKLLTKATIKNIKKTVSNETMYNVKYDESNYTELVGVDQIIENTASNIAKMEALKPQSPSPMDVDTDNNDNDGSKGKKRRRSMRNVNKSVTYKYESFKLSDEEEEKSESEKDIFDDTDEYDPSSNSNSNIKKKRKKKKRRMKKRKRSLSDDIKSTEPQIKKRKIESNIPTNTNSSMKQERDSSDDDDNKQSNNVLASFPKDADSKWKQYTMGLIKLRYKVEPETHLITIGDLWCQFGQKVKMEYEYSYKENQHWLKEFEAFKIFLDEVFANEMAYHDNRRSNIQIEMKNVKLIKKAKQTKKKNAESFEKLESAKEMFLETFGEKALKDVLGEKALKKNDEKSKEAEIIMPFKNSKNNQPSSYNCAWSFDDTMDIGFFKYTTPGVYESELFVSFARVASMYTEIMGNINLNASVMMNKTEFELSMIKTMAFVTNNKQILDDYMDTIRLIDDYKNKGHKFTLVSLLDYSVKYTVDSPEQLTINQAKYGMNLLTYFYSCYKIVSRA